MQIAVTFRHREPDEQMKEYVREKVARLEKYLDNPREVHIVLSSEKFRQTAEITILADRGALNGEGRDDDLYAAIDQMVSKIERQLRERRGKEKRKRASSPVTLLQPEEEMPSEGREDVPGFIQKRRMIVKPMSVEEAAAQLNLLPQDFFIFVNSESSQINVLYRRKEGGFDWIEPSLK